MYTLKACKSSFYVLPLNQGYFTFLYMGMYIKLYDANFMLNISVSKLDHEE